MSPDAEATFHRASCTLGNQVVRSSDGIAHVAVNGKATPVRNEPLYGRIDTMVDQRPNIADVIASGGVATTPETSRRMSEQASKDTQIELRLRQHLHGRGLRYRVHVRPVPSLRRVADIVFRRSRVAVFVDGCFWHGCPMHGTWPKRNAVFWSEKIRGNVLRDSATDHSLAAAGWLPVRVWEHEDLDVVAERIEALVRGRAGESRRRDVRPGP
jgi:DNA mismatch endonuclease, patch repair protein